MTEETPLPSHHLASSVRVDRPPPVCRRIWVLGFDKPRIDRAAAVLEAVGHKVKSCEPGGELGNTIRDFRPDMIVIDMQEHPDRGRHAAGQLRADRATRQLPILLVGVTGEERSRADKSVTGPTRRYQLSLDAPSVLNAILVDL